ncbi:MAG: glutaredoxin family protein [Actinomycetia bacterium]|nr:glutaredoxin family protein [Actinomycetes bacterium]
MSPRVVLVGKPDCHLCDVARQVVETVCAEFDLDADERSIHDDPYLAAEYADRVPVVLVDDAEISHFRISAEQLRKALSQ